MFLTCSLLQHMCVLSFPDADSFLHRLHLYAKVFSAFGTPHSLQKLAVIVYYQSVLVCDGTNFCHVNDQKYIYLHGNVLLGL